MWYGQKRHLLHSESVLKIVDVSEKKKRKERKKKKKTQQSLYLGTSEKIEIYLKIAKMHHRILQTLN